MADTDDRAQNEQLADGESTSAQATVDAGPGGELKPADPAPGAPKVQSAQFSELDPSPNEGGEAAFSRVMDVTVKVSVELGRAEVQLHDIASLNAGSVLELSKKAGDPVDLILNGRVLAQGEVVVVEENFGIRITKVTDPQVTIQTLQ